MSCAATCISICHESGAEQLSTPLGTYPGSAAQSDQRCPGPARTGLLRNPMNAMAPTRPTELQGCRVRLTTGPTAAGEARSQVRAAICAWDVPVDVSVAVLLTSELVTNAIRHEPGETVTLAITCAYGQLRVDVHDTSGSFPVLVDAPADAETGRGLMLVATLSARVGRLPHPGGQGRVLHPRAPARSRRRRVTRPPRAPARSRRRRVTRPPRAPARSRRRRVMRSAGG